MANGNQQSGLGGLGGLGGLSKDEFDNLSLGFSMTNPSGVFGLTKGQATNLATSFNPITSAIGTVGSAMTQYNAEKAAQSALGLDRGFVDTVKGMFTDPALDTARGIADVNKDGIVSNREAQNFSMNKGMMTAYGVGLNPMSGYSPGSVSVQGLTEFGKADPDAGLGGIDITGQVADVMTQQQVDDMFSGIDTTSGVTGLGGGKGASYSGVTNFSPTEGVDTTGEQGQQTGDQTSFTGGKGGMSFADDAATSDQGDDGTYICTALYDMGDMKAYIYKYDQLYGRRVNPLTYKGYCLWGKYVATKMKSQGWTYRIAKPLALAWAKQMAFDLSKGRHGKKNRVVKIISKIGEGICYALGFVANLKIKKGVKYG